MRGGGLDSFHKKLHLLRCETEKGFSFSFLSHSKKRKEKEKTSKTTSEFD